MKTTLLALMVAATAAVAQQASPTVKVGSTVKLDSVIAADWLQGEPPKAFEPGKVYLFECWATWCGPCVAAIPHINELYNKYHAKGFNVYGMDVREDGKEKVAKFVKAKGDGMSYPVAYTGKDSAFENEWLKAAGLIGIPQAIVVKDGKIVMIVHPNQLSETVIEALLSGEDGAQKAVAQINADQALQQKASALMSGFYQASGTNDVTTMAAKLAELEQLDPHHSFLPAMQLDLFVAKKDWDGATRAVKGLPDGSRQASINKFARMAGMDPNSDCSPAFVAAVCKAYADMLAEPASRTNPLSLVTLAYLQWKTADQDAAIASAKKAAAAAAAPGASFPAAPFERLAKSLADGTLPAGPEFFAWLQKAVELRNANPGAKPAKPAAVHE